MGYQVYRVKKDDGGYRFGGYGVPTVCEFPSCNEEIDRGMSFACGGEPFSEYGCDRYFCSKHLNYTYFDPETDTGRCQHEDDCDCEAKEVCDRCAKGEEPFPYKPEHIDWVVHVLKDKSWKEWRKEEPEMVAEYKKIVNQKIKPMTKLKPQSEFPLLEKYKKVFPIADNTIFAYDDTIYFNGYIGHISDDLIVHEETHLKQQKLIGLDKWVEQYLTDPRFRLSQEIEAYQAQLDSIKDVNKRAGIRLAVLKDLSGPLYGNLISLEEARKLLK